MLIQARRSLAEQPDIHARLMSQYPQVPEWWYLCIFVAMFAFGIIAIEVWPTQMPVWAFVLALAVAFVYTVPIGIIQAVTNQQIGLNVITEVIVGYVLPGRPLAMMLFKTWGYVVRACSVSDYSSADPIPLYVDPTQTSFSAVVGMAACACGVLAATSGGSRRSGC